MEYPRLMYRTNAATHMAVVNDAEREAALKAGWFDTVPEAIAGKANVPVKEVPVTVYKKTGVAVEKHTAANDMDAANLIATDGWHPTEAAAIAAAWPAPDAVPGIVEQLRAAQVEELAVYALGIGMKVKKDEKAGALLARIETTLLTGPTPAGK